MCEIILNLRKSLISEVESFDSTNLTKTFTNGQSRQNDDRTPRESHACTAIESRLFVFDF